MKNSPALVETYQNRKQQAEKEVEARRKRGRQVSNFRGLSFAAFTIFLIFSIKDQRADYIVYTALCFAAFILLIIWHARIFKAELAAERWALVNDFGLKRVSDSWHELPKDGAQFIDPAHGYAGDLDLFGSASLFQKVSAASTQFGEQALARALLEPTDIKQAQARQAAVRELAPELDFRQRLESISLSLTQKRRGGRVVSGAAPAPDELLAWAQEQPSKVGHPFVLTFSLLLPLISVAGIVAHSFAGFSYLFWLLPLSVALLLTVFTNQDCGRCFTATGSGEGAFADYADILVHLENFEAKSDYLKDLLASLKNAKGQKPSKVMQAFQARVGWFSLRNSGIVYPFINLIILWDLQMTRSLERWRTDSGPSLENWFRVIGEVEMLSSFAGLLHDEPEAELPELLNDGRIISAQAVGHPLLTPALRRSNPIAPLNGGRALLITGSNMSGKSTYLRAIGQNIVLGLAGAPTVSQKLKLSRLILGTSLRIGDSLAEGVSHFYAEVNQLARIVQQAEKGEPVFFLLDEILHGTNSRERQIGARWVLSELLAQKSLGILTTHDSELCTLPAPLNEQVKNGHFREEVQNEEMSFDYQLREGPVTSGNALRVMRKVGLQVPLE